MQKPIIRDVLFVVMYTVLSVLVWHGIEKDGTSESINEKISAPSNTPSGKSPPIFSPRLQTSDIPKVQAGLPLAGGSHIGSAEVPGEQGAHVVSLPDHTSKVEFPPEIVPNANRQNLEEVVVLKDLDAVSTDEMNELLGKERPPSLSSDQEGNAGFPDDSIPAASNPEEIIELQDL